MVPSAVLLHGENSTGPSRNRKYISKFAVLQLYGSLYNIQWYHHALETFTTGRLATAVQHACPACELK
jgi:hypothetical protein